MRCCTKIYLWLFVGVLSFPAPPAAGRDAAERSDDYGETRHHTSEHHHSRHTRSGRDARDKDFLLGGVAYGQPPASVWHAVPPPGYGYAPNVVVRAAPLPGPAPAGFWYQCDNPPGYYPYVAHCQTQWREVPARPTR
jgi:hypothetical protein